MINSYRRIWAMLSPPERVRFVLLMGLTLLMGLFELISVAGILPLLSVLAEPELVETNAMLRWYAGVLGLEEFEDIALALGVTVFALVIVGTAVRAVVTYAQIRFALGRGYSIAARILHGHLSQTYAWYLNRNTAALSQSLLSEVDQVVRESVLPAVLIISNVIVMLLIGGLLLVAEPFIAVGAIGLLVGVYVLAFVLLRQRIIRTGQRRMAANGQRFRVVQEVTGSLKDIKVMGLERLSLQRFRAPALAMAHHQTLGLVMQRLPRFALEAVVYGGFVAAILILLVIRGRDMAELLPILGLLAISATKLFPALQQTYQQISSLRLSAPALERLHADIEAAARHGGPLAKRDGPRLPVAEAITLDDVTYRYPEGERDTLAGLNLSIPARSTVGIVGGTGAGKTTVIDLVLGLLHPDGGAIRVDGTALTGERIREWQRNIGYVPQAIFLSDDTVAANIAFGISAAEVDMDKVVAAAKMAHLDAFVRAELPQGYDTKVGERGLRLSGGQRQRIGIARALYHNPDVLILDEATSALDNITERAVMEAVRDLGGQKTIIMIAHRLSTVENCDKIMLLEHGRLLDEGPYDYLIAHNETFASMVNA